MLRKPDPAKHLTESILTLSQHVKGIHTWKPGINCIMFLVLECIYIHKILKTEKQYAVQKTPNI